MTKRDDCEVGSWRFDYREFIEPEIVGRLRGLICDLLETNQRLRMELLTGRFRERDERSGIHGIARELQTLDARNSEELRQRSG
jgi:hypothetical protein